MSERRSGLTRFTSRFACLAAGVLSLAVVRPAAAATISWAGYTWEVRNDTGGPGPNTWSPGNVSVDSNGYLHLKIAKVGNTWTCAEITKTAPTVGYGTYSFVVSIDTFDRNVIFGMFNYPQASVGPDGTNEIDMEIGKFGNANSPNLNYTVYPKALGSTPRNVSQSTNFTIDSGYDTLHKFVWRSGTVAFTTIEQASGRTSKTLGSWTTPSSFASQIGGSAEPVHLNLWLNAGNAPSNGQAVEVIVKSFTYTP